MKIYLFYILLIFLSIQEMTAQKMIIKPEMPKSGEELKIIYDPSGIHKEMKNRKLVVYSFKSNSNIPEKFEQELFFDSTLSIFTSSFTIPDSVVFGMFRIAGHDQYGILRFDDNSGDWWDFYVYSENQIKRENASTKGAASWLGNLTSGINRNINYNLAQKLLTEETKLYEGNIFAQIGLTSLLFDLKKISKDDFYSLMRNHLNNKPNMDDEQTVRAISRALSILNESEKAKQIELIFIKNNPNSKLAQEYFLDELALVSNIKEFTDKSIEFINRFPDSDKLNMIYNALFNAYLQSDNFSELMQILNKIETKPNEMMCDLGIRLALNKSYLPNISNEARLDSAKTIFDTFFISLKSSESDLFHTDYEISKGNLALNWSIANSIINESEALNYYQISSEFLQNSADYNFYKNYSEFLLNNAKKDIAFEILVNAIKFNEYDDDMVDQYFRLRKEIFNENEEEAQENFNDLLTFQKEFIESNLKFEELSIPIGNFLLKDLTNRAKEFSSTISEVSIVFFWATWCGPCQASFLSYNDIHDYYENDSKIQVISINLWDTIKSTEELTKFKIENDLNFPVLYDEFAKSVENFGINGLPVIAIVDKDMNIKFKINGFTNGDEFINDIIEKVEYLLQ